MQKDIRNINLYINLTKSKTGTSKNIAGKILEYKINLSTKIRIQDNVTNKNILKFPEITYSSEEIETLLSNEIHRYKSIWQALSKFDCAIIQNKFDYTENRSLGNLDCYDPHGKTYFINSMI